MLWGPCTGMRWRCGGSGKTGEHSQIMRVVILGGGYLGGALALHWVSRRHQIHLVGHATLFPQLQLRLPPELQGHVHFIAADLTRSPAGLLSSLLRGASKKVDLVVHAVGPTGNTRCQADPLRARLLHAQLPVLLTLFHPGPRILYLSSMHVYGGAGVESPPPWGDDTEPHPNTLYGALKRQGEWALSNEGGTLWVRCASVYGIAPGLDPSSVFCRWRRAWAEDVPLSLDGDGAHLWDFLHLRDFLDAVTLLAESSSASGGYNLGGGPVIMQDALRTFCQVGRSWGWGDSSPRVRVESPGAIRPGCALRAERLLTEFGWAPRVPLAHGLEEYFSMPPGGERAGPI